MPSFYSYHCHIRQRLLLPDTQEALTRRDLVTEGTTNLGRGEGHAVVVELEQSLEVQELALSSLGAQETRELAGGSNAASEHEVEHNGLGNVVAGLWRFDLVSTHKFAELGARVVIDLSWNQSLTSLSLQNNNAPSENAL